MKTKTELKRTMSYTQRTISVPPSVCFSVWIAIHPHMRALKMAGTGRVICKTTYMYIIKKPQYIIAGEGPYFLQTVYFKKY